MFAATATATDTTVTDGISEVITTTKQTPPNSEVEEQLENGNNDSSVQENGIVKQDQDENGNHESSLVDSKLYQPHVHHLAENIIIRAYAPGTDKPICPPVPRKSTATVRVIIWNNTKGEYIKLETHKDWFGKTFAYYPPKSIQANTAEMFMHRAVLCHGCDKKGSLGAVLYSGSNTDCETNFNSGWLVAWYVPYQGPNKVLVRVLELNDCKCMDWKEVKKDLSCNKALTHKAEAKNKATGCVAYAAFEDDSSKNTKLEVSFGVIYVEPPPVPPCPQDTKEDECEDECEAQGQNGCDDNPCA